jgi:pyrroloquinoline quinone biosynthesis protein B
MQSSAAISADGERWFLLNASPDVHRQVSRLSARPPEGIRHVPVEGVVVTDAELDHTLGLVLLREGGHLQLCATHAVRQALEQDSRILPVTQAFAEVKVTELPLSGSLTLCYRDGGDSGLELSAFSVPAGPPRFVTQELPGHTVGLSIRDRSSGGVCTFVPGCGGLEGEVMSRLEQADLVLFDGTFWSDDELIALGIGERTALQMDHLPISGPDGSLEHLTGLPAADRVYTHINNTNPILIEDSPQRAAVEGRGVKVGADGMRFTL